MTAYSFKDSKGNEREIRVTFQSIFDVAEACGVDLLNPATPDEDGQVLTTKLLNDPSLLVKIVAAIVGDYSAEFFNAIDGETYRAMHKAFWDAYNDFFVQSGREWIALGLKKALTLQEKKLAEAKEKMLESPNATSSTSSSSQDSTTGDEELSGKSPAPPKQGSGSSLPTEPVSSRRSTTRTSQEGTTSARQKTSTTSQKQKPSRKRKSS